MRKVLLIAVAATVLLAACGGSGSSKSGGKNDTEFSSLYDKRNNATLRVTYQNTDSSGQAGDTFTISQAGANKIAYLHDNEKTVIDGDTVTQCSDLDATPTCETVPGGPDAAKAAIAGYTQILNLAGTYIAAASTSGGFGDTSSETIAGRSADCVKITASSALGKLGGAAAKLFGGNSDAGVQACIDKDTGFLLKYAAIGTDSDKTTIVATEVGQPKDDDFTIPATTSTTVDSGSSGTTPDTSTGDTTDTTTGDTTDTTACTPYTLPGGVTPPSGVTMPCIPTP